MTSERIVRLATQILPPHRRAWGDAMRSEFANIDPGEALIFALGCLTAAIHERIRPMKAFVTTGRFTVAAVTALYGIGLFGVAAFNAAGVMALGYEDYHQSRAFIPFTQETTRALFDAMAGALALQGAMMAAHLAAAFFLASWRPRGFLISAGAILLMAPVIAVYGPPGQFGSLDGSLMRSAVMLVPLLLLTGAAAALAVAGRWKPSAA